jgi:hypothetical protein
MSATAVESGGTCAHPNLSLTANFTKVIEVQSLFPQTVWSCRQRLMKNWLIQNLSLKNHFFGWNSAK